MFHVVVIPLKGCYSMWQKVEYGLYFVMCKWRSLVNPCNKKILKMRLISAMGRNNLVNQ